MKVKVTIEGREYEVDLKKQPHERFPSEISINGKSLDLDIPDDWSSHSVKTLITNGESLEVQFIDGEDGLPTIAVASNREYPLEVQFPGKEKLMPGGLFGGKTASGAGSILAPMPGKVTRVFVKEGEEVEEGQVCLVLEAMKMENELEAAKAGKITKISVQEGEAVDLDDLLVTIE